MITVYFADSTHSICSQTLKADEPLPPNTIWVDLLHPTAEEEESVERQLDIHIPTREQVWKNETLNRFYEESGHHYMTAAIITKGDTPHPDTSAITFAMSKHRLVTLRHIAPTSFQNFASRVLAHPQKFTTGPALLEGLLEEIIGRVAFNAEHVVKALDMLSHQVFDATVFDGKKGAATTMLMKKMLMELGKCADLNSKINESLYSLARLVDYFSQVKSDRHLGKALHTLDTDIRALIQQTAFLSDKVTFLLDTTMGLINVEQNMIIKLFSVVTVFLLPPTLIAGIYGMNFEHMPELRWATGYPYALFLMFSVAIVPYLVFRKKGLL